MKTLVATARFICAILIVLEATVVAAGTIGVEENGRYGQSDIANSATGAVSEPVSSQGTWDNFIPFAGAASQPGSEIRRRIASELIDTCIDSGGCEFYERPDDLFELTLVLQDHCLSSGGCERSALSEYLQQVILPLCCGKSVPKDPQLLVKLFPNPISGVSKTSVFGIPTFWNAAWPYLSGSWDRSYHVIDFNGMAEEESNQNAREILRVWRGAYDGRRASSLRNIGFEIDITSTKNDNPEFVYMSTDIGGLGTCTSPEKNDCKDLDKGEIGEGDTLIFKPDSDIWINELVFAAKYPDNSNEQDLDEMLQMNTVIGSSLYTLKAEMSKDVIYYNWKPDRPYFIAAFTPFEISHFRENFSLTSMHLHTQSPRNIFTTYCDAGCARAPEPAPLGLMLLGIFCVSVSKFKKGRRSGSA